MKLKFMEPGEPFYLYCNDCEKVVELVGRGDFYECKECDGLDFEETEKSIQKSMERKR